MTLASTIHPSGDLPMNNPTKLFAPTVVRMDERGDWYVMNGRERGWGRYARGPYLTLDDVRAEYGCTIDRAGEDEHSTYREVSP